MEEETEANMNVEVISVGTELLIGNTINSDAAYISEQCTRMGYSVNRHTVVGDQEDCLEEAIKQAGERADIIMISGGLGPTEDDLTKKVTAKALGKSLVDDKVAKKNVEDYYKKGKIKEMPKNNLKQAKTIEGAIVLYNHNGTAPGFIIDTKDHKHYVLLPGPPNELVPMFEEYVLMYLRKLQKESIKTKVIKVYQIGESKVEEEILDLIQKQSNPTIATYAKTGEVHIQITGRAEDDKKAEKLLKPIVKEINKRFGNNVYSMDEKETLEDNVVHLLMKKGLTLATAESCTGGLFAGKIVNVSGSSKVFQHGFITYSNKSKRKILGVSKDTLKKYGAVSKQTAKEMAKHTALGSDSDIAIAITGVAGPGGGSEDKPVGTVFIACYYDGNTTVKENHFVGGRQKIRENAVAVAMGLLRDCLISIQ